MMNIRHKNLIFLILGIVAAIGLGQNKVVVEFISKTGYVGAILAGALFTSTFTAVAGGLLILVLAKSINWIVLVSLAGVGAVMADWLIFRFIKNEAEGEIEPIFKKINGGHFYKILHTKYFGWTLPVLGALIIMSPLPDELGIGLIGMTKIKPERFLAISFFSHLLGLSLIVLGGSIDFK